MATGGDWRSELNDAQRRAVEHSGGPLIVLAGPGTGKTRAIIARVRRLIEEGAEPESIVALAFSVKAAEEMRTRLAAAIDPRVAERAWMGTFHSYGRRLVQRFGDMIGLRMELSIMDSAQQKRLLRRLVREGGLFRDWAAEGLDGVVHRARAFIGYCRNGARTPEDAAAYARAWAGRVERNEKALEGDERAAERQACAEFGEMSPLYAAYDRACVNEGLVTFDDYLTLPLRIFREKPVAASIVRTEVRHLLVDEFQDANRAQIELLRHLAPSSGASTGPDLCVVGDDDQAIYGFRGADTRAFKHFADLWTSRDQVELTENYRNAPPIIDAANAVIRACNARFAPDKRIEPPDAGSSGGSTNAPASVEGVILDSDSAAGVTIAAMILADRARLPTPRWRDYGVLVAVNTTGDLIAAELGLRDIPVAQRRLTPADDPGVKDVLAWIGVLVDAGAGGASHLQRLLVRPPCGAPVERVAAWTRAHARGASEGEARPLTEWLGAHEEATGFPGVRRLLSLVNSLREKTATLPADQVLWAVINGSGVAHAEDLTPRERARRVEHLAKVLRFARARQGALEEPGDLHAFWRYYHDLDQKEQQFETPGDERLDADADETGDEAGDAVSVLTAHKAKGLEFESVFIAQVRPGGFPATARNRADAVDPPPAEFLGREAEDRADEQRRLFYVACTRASRRLVLLAKRKKARGSAADYFIELTQDAPRLGVLVRESREWLDQAGLEPPNGLDEEEQAAGDSETGAAGVLRRAASGARREAASALWEAAQAGAEGAAAGALASIETRLTSAARLIAGLEHLRVFGTLPGWARDGAGQAGEPVARLRTVADRLARGAASPGLTRPLVPPLRLSFSQIKDYNACARCYYARYQLGLDEAESGGLIVGSVIHKALEQFYRELRLAEADALPLPGSARLLALGEKTFRDHWPRSLPLDAAQLDAVRAQLGLVHARLHDDANVLFIEESVRFDHPCRGGTHAFTAKMDRVDQLADGRFRIVDYKSGQALKKYLEPAKDDLQLCVYAMALPHLLGLGDGDGTVPGIAEYWCLATGQRGSIDLAELRLDKARAMIDKAINGMLEGRFPRGKERDCRGLCELLGPE